MIFIVMFLLRALMLSLLFGASAKVVQDFQNECGQFFANRRSPTIFPEPQYRQICQALNNVYYYATFYDTDNKIPVYSAYKFEGLKDCKRTNRWYIEPQLDDKKESSSMKCEKDVKIQQLGDHQALNGDYDNSGYDKGHLAPVFQALSQSCADATFTLTNAAPQDRSFNRGQWKKLEKSIAEELSEQCLSKKYSVYIVTGVVPGASQIKNRVKVPSHFWTAYCCLDNNNKCQISRGFIGENKNITPKDKTVGELEKDLTTLYNVGSFELFDNSIKLPQQKQSELFHNNKAPVSYCLKEKLYQMFSSLLL
ncbi:endonuclease domain-containing 1 protein-like [Puntigrus tetrazona]|uniref:endonuclease domain-containing 1 protein-like n=1 Tax=Puntigrus tetrazona TaxID=1606681 RepID=UPI001C8A537E|nr:endonuclease domain-containing 1 protein-like [Puntigrus tetrazona]